MVPLEIGRNDDGEDLLALARSARRLPRAPPVLRFQQRSIRDSRQATLAIRQQSNRLHVCLVRYDIPLLAAISGA